MSSTIVNKLARAIGIFGGKVISARASGHLFLKGSIILKRVSTPPKIIFLDGLFLKTMNLFKYLNKNK